MNDNINYIKALEFREAIFNLLYEEENINAGIQSALSLIGKFVHISRAYVFEYNEESKQLSATFEWHKSGVKPRKVLLNTVKLNSLFENEDIFIDTGTKVASRGCGEILISRKACATFQYAIKDNDALCGVIRFDDYDKPRPDWSEGNIVRETLIFVSRVISNYLLKARKIQHMGLLRKSLQESLDVERKIREETIKAADEKSNFLARMSHDMRTPMNGLLCLAALSEDETEIDILKQNIQKIHTSGEYLLGLINDILDSQKIEAGRLRLNPQVVNGEAFIEDLLLIVRRFAMEKNIKIKSYVPKDKLNVFIKIDPIRTKQLFLNLLSNAVKFSHENSTVEFYVDLVGVDNNIREMTVRIKDNGIGMSEAYLSGGLFKSFSQEYNEMSSKNASTGLGLYIVKHLVDLMDGTIKVESKLQKGTQITVKLNVEVVHECAAAKIASDDIKNLENIRNTLMGKVILLVEDHLLNAEVARRLLSKMGCEVIWVENGKLGVEQFENSIENEYDAILMDIRMPIMNGLESAAAIRALSREDAKNIPIIAMTANAYEEDIRASLDAGMNDHIAKPIDTALLYKTLAKYIRQNQERERNWLSCTTEATRQVIQIGMETLCKMIGKTSEQDGAWAVGYEAFQRTHEFLVRNMPRLEKSSQMVLFTVNNSNQNSDLYHELSNTIKFSLRSGDLMMNLNETQIVALFVNCDSKNGEVVVKRILNAANCGSEKIENVVHYEICDIMPASPI